VSVECTAAIVEIWLCERGPQPQSEVQLRLMYSMALLRMVNGICDPSQRGKFAGSMMTLSRRLGLPPVLVDLRHAATHGNLPALPALQSASQEAMQWLSSNYWEHQQNQADSVGTEAAQKTAVQRFGSVLREYRKCRAAAMQRLIDDGGQLQELKGIADTESVSEARKVASACEGVDAPALVSVLLDSNLLIPKAAASETDRAADASVIAEQQEASHTPAAVDGVFCRLQAVWYPALIAVAQRQPQLRRALLDGAVDRLLSEGETCATGGADERHQSADSLQQLRLGLLQRWALDFMSSGGSTRSPGNGGNHSVGSVDSSHRNRVIVRCLDGANPVTIELVAQHKRQMPNGGVRKYGDRLDRLVTFGKSMCAIPCGMAEHKEGGSGGAPAVGTALQPALATVGAAAGRWEQIVAARVTAARKVANVVSTSATSQLDPASSDGAWMAPLGWTATSLTVATIGAAPANGGLLSLELPPYIDHVSLYPSGPAHIAEPMTDSTDMLGSQNHLATISAAPTAGTYSLPTPTRWEDTLLVQSSQAATQAVRSEGGALSPAAIEGLRNQIKLIKSSA
jgi:hypothetical protein